MANYVPSIPDTKKWKKLISTLAKEHSHPGHDASHGLKVIASDDIGETKIKKPCKKKVSRAIKKAPPRKAVHKVTKNRGVKTVKGKKKKQKK